MEDVEEERPRADRCGPAVGAEPAHRVLEGSGATVLGHRRAPRRRARAVRRAGARTTSTTSGRRSVTSFRLRVNSRTSSPARCTWMRAPSSFHSTLAAPPTAASASATDVGRRRQHRAQRAAAPGAAPPPARHSPPARAARAVATQLPAEHQRPGGRRRGHRRRLGDGVGHHPLERALAQLAGEQPAEEATLLRRRLLEQRAQQAGPALGRPRARRSWPARRGWRPRRPR